MLAQQKERWNKVGLTVSQLRSMTSKAGHAVGMQYFMDRTKYCLGFWDEDQISLKIMVFSKKSSIVITLRFLTFRPKIIMFSKKKVFTSDQPQISLIPSQTLVFFTK